jgi:hypothetical protein
MLGLVVLCVLDHSLCGDSYRRPVIAEFIRVSLYRPAIKDRAGISSTNLILTIVPCAEFCGFEICRNFVGSGSY